MYLNVTHENLFLIDFRSNWQRETIKLLDENVERRFCDLELRKDFLNGTQILTTQEKCDISSYVKSQKVCLSKDIVNTVKRQGCFIV